MPQPASVDVSTRLVSGVLPRTIRSIQPFHTGLTGRHTVRVQSPKLPHLKWRRVNRRVLSTKSGRNLVQLKVTGRHVGITEVLRRYVQNQLERLMRYGMRLGRAQDILPLSGGTAQAKILSPEMYTALDWVIEKLSRQKEKRKVKKAIRKVGRIRNSRRWPLSAMTHPVPVVSIIRPSVASVTRKEAFQHLGREDFSLLVFFTLSVNRIHVMRRLTDGGIELIKPRIPSGLKIE